MAEAAARDGGLSARIRRGEAVVAGVLSGTSADGIDVGLVRFSEDPSADEPDGSPTGLGPPRCEAFETRPFPEDLGRRVREVLDGAPCDLRGAALLSRDLGRAFGEAARAGARDHGLELDVVGSHGQTVYHHDGCEASGSATLQLGDGDFVAASSGALTVSDFRQADIAAGGDGAPLSALADPLLFAQAERPYCVLNLGGMANLTVVSDASLLSFDTGPAGSLLDGLARRFLGRPFDEDGRTAARGRAQPALVEELLRHPFFDRSPPKSTGRDTFGEAWVDGVAEYAEARDATTSMEDLFATAVDFVAAGVAVGLERFTGPVAAELRTLIVAGGGGRNAALVDALARRTGLVVRSSAAFGVDPEAREALVFAVLAARAVLGLPSTVESATGAAEGRILGKISRPTPARW